MSTIYIVQELGWEYNDEVMYLPESGGGTPKGGFSSKSAAKEEKNRRDYKQMKGTRPSEYGYDISDVITDVEELNEILREIKHQEIDEDKFSEFEFSAKLTFEEYLKIEPYIKFSFYEIVECEFKDQ